MKYDLCIIGGAGHVGLPLSVAFANNQVKTVLFDLNHDWLEKIRQGKFPFKEDRGDEELRRALLNNYLFTSTEPDVIGESEFVLLVIGTPIDEYLNPDFNGFLKTIDQYFPHFQDGQVLILRSTVYPGTSERVQKYFNDRNKKVLVTFCPERIAQGKSLEELKTLPQIVSAFDEGAVERVTNLFKRLTPKVVQTEKPIEAELAKLFSNAWRYIKFSVANQFLMIAKDHDLDYEKIHQAMTVDYQRNSDLPRPGFAAGPCLLKDTMQLASFNNNNFFLGHSAMLVNEGLPSYLITKLRSQHKLKEKTIGILGMTFKADSDDIRDSLSYKLKKVAQAEAKEVLCHDVYLKDPALYDLDTVLRRSDVIILATPHTTYHQINPQSYPDKTFVDIWGFWQQLPQPTKKILITGGAGFIGCHLARHLLNEYGQSARLVLVDNFQRGKRDWDFEQLLSDHRVSFLNLDLTDLKSYEQLGKGYDHVYHLAAINGTRNFYEMPHEVMRINTLSLVYILDWLRQHNPTAKLCFTSSNEAYAGGLNAFNQLPIPTAENVPLVIEDPYNPRWSYAATKLAGELFVINYAKMYNFPAVIVRPHNFYGPRAGFDHVIPEFISKILKRTDPFSVYGSDETRTFCYISDAVRAMQMLMDSSATNKQPIETVHIGDHREISAGDLAEAMFHIAGWRPQLIERKNSLAGSVKRRRADISKLQKLVSWHPEVSLEEGLARTFKWYANL